MREGDGVRRRQRRLARACVSSAGWVACLGLGLVAVSCDDDAVSAGGLSCPSGSATYAAETGNGTTFWCKRPDGVAHGPYEERDAEGELLVRGAFADGLADGDWHRFSLDAEHAPVADEGYAAGQPNGHWTTWDENGAPRSEHDWAYGVPCGTWLELEAGVEVTRVERVACDRIDAPEPVVGPPLAVVGNFGWDGQTCPAGAPQTLPGDPTARACMVDGMLDGPWGRWLDASTKVAGGEYTAGVATGTWRTWYPSGSVHEEGTQGAAGREGLWRSWRVDRTLETEATWQDDALDGPATTYWPHGTRESTGSYRGGEKTGTWTRWYPSGIEAEIDTWVVAGTPPVGLREGPYAKSHPQGVHAEAGQYLAGLQSGDWQTWHDNGVKATAGRYEAGLSTGVWQVWERDGLIGLEGPFVTGIAHGEFSIWSWQYGARIKSVGTVLSGVLQGPWHASYVGQAGGGDTGGPAGDVTYFDGVREGTSTTFWETGALASEGPYHRGEVVGRWKFYYENGQLRLDVGFLGLDYDGEYHEYYENGQVKAEGTWENGRKLDDWRYWTEDGRPTTEGGL